MSRRRGLLLAATVVGILVLALVVVATTLLQPRRLARMVLETVGDAAGLEVRFEGDARYRLRGTPLLEVGDVTVRNPGDPEPMLRAARVLVSLPWSTVRERGTGPLVIERIELDSPVLDVPRLLAWLGTRPPGDGAIPTLRDGLHVQDGRLVGEAWEIRNFDLRVPLLAGDAPVSAAARGTLLLASPMRLRFDLQLAATRPAIDAGLALRGPVQLEGDAWKVPAFLAASGAPRRTGDAWRVPLRFGASGAFQGQGEPLHFAFGVQGPLRMRADRWTLAPAGVALRGDGGMVPSLSARGHAVVGPDLSVALDGRMPDWPTGWPALPPPLDAAGPSGVALRYQGPMDLSAPVGLRLARGDARLEATGRLHDVLAWLDPAAEGTPLPPLNAVAHAQRVEVSGAVIEGLEIELDGDPEGHLEPR